jgi:hypothetical protein
MRVVKVLSCPSDTFREAVKPWSCVEVVSSMDAIPKYERFIKYKDGAWVVYKKSSVHLATPRYINRFDNILSAVHSARLLV